MGCCRNAPSWLTARAPIATKPTTTMSSTLVTFFKPMAIFFCTNGPIDSSSSFAESYRRRWSNPLRRRRLDQPPEIVRHWVEAESNHSLPPQERVMVVSYNILGDRNAFKHRDLYQNVPSIYMTWGYRKRIICEELIGWNADIICLQEVDRYFDLSNVMEKAGYLGLYKRRTGDTVDGCAMFWKADKFQLLEAESIEFKQYGLRDNVAQLSVFEMLKADSKRLVVGNIHVLYNPRRGDVKLGQIRFFSSRAHSLSEKWGNASVVLAGDYNSTPQLNIMLHDRRDLSGQRSCRPTQVLGLKREKSSLFVLMDRFFKYCWTDEEVKVAAGSPECGIVMHPLKLNSSYATVKGSTRTRSPDGEPLATSYHSKFLGTVDYLWYSRGLLPTRVLETVTIDVLSKTDGLPCEKLGSDHLALVSEFAFMPATEEDNKVNTMTTSATLSALASPPPEEDDDSFV